jgi:hypothetical protein
MILNHELIRKFQVIQATCREINGSQYLLAQNVFRKIRPGKSNLNKTSQVEYSDPIRKSEPILPDPIPNVEQPKKYGVDLSLLNTIGKIKSRIVKWFW